MTIRAIAAVIGPVETNITCSGWIKLPSTGAVERDTRSTGGEILVHVTTVLSIAVPAGKGGSSGRLRYDSLRRSDTPAWCAIPFCKSVKLLYSSM